MSETTPFEVAGRAPRSRIGGRLAVALTGAIACALFGAVTGSHVLAGSLTLAFVIVATVGPRLAWSPPAQALGAVSCGIFMAASAPVWPLAASLGDRVPSNFFYVLSGASLSFMALRGVVRAPVGGTSATLAVGLLGFLGIGRVDAGAIFPLALAGYLAIGFAAVRLQEPARSPWARGWRHPTAVAITVGCALTLTFGLARLLPQLYAHAHGWAASRTAGDVRAGFREGPLALGSLEGMLQSREIVARVEGDFVTHLRGAVYDRYRGGRWLPAEAGASFAIGAGDPAENGFFRVRFTGKLRDRFALPVGASAVHFDPPDARIDRLGIARLPVGERPRAISFASEGLPRFAIEAPRERDLQVPDALRGELGTLVASWTSASAGPAERVAAIERALERDYTYSLQVRLPEPGSTAMAPGDPILHFLGEGRRGHCEYFAASMTLLARTAGVPARLVTGYRVAERNPLADYAIVRERHAHAWTEVHFADRGWVTIDPSPSPAEALGEVAETAFMGAVLDLARLWLAEYWRVALLVALVVWFVVLQVRRLVAGSPRPTLQARGPGPPAQLEALLGALAGAGRPRAESEPLERYAARLERPERADLPPLEPAAVLIARYAALRYGDQGDAEALDRDVRHWLPQLGRS